MFSVLTRIKSIATAAAFALALVLGAGSALLPTSSQAALTFSTATKTNMMTAVLTDIAGGTIKIYNGTKPSSLGTPAGTLCATLTLGSPAGTVTSGVLTVGSVTQSNGSHVSCTPTFIRFSNSGGTAVADIDIGVGAGNVTFTGTVVTGQNVTVTGLTLTAGN